MNAFRSLNIESESVCMVLVVGRVLHTLPEGKDVWGVTSLDSLLYVLRNKASYEISVYDTISYRLQRRLNVPGLEATKDMVSCAYNYCLYISGHQCIHRMALPHAAVNKWQVNEEVDGLSVTDTHSVLVTCPNSRQVKEFTTFGRLLREIKLAQDVMSPNHAIQLSSGQFLVCHGYNDPVHRVCLIGADGQVVKAYGGPPGSGNRQVNTPVHMAVDSNGVVYVADLGNRRVFLLSPELTYVRDVASREQLKWDPMRLFLDTDKGRLYVAENEWKDGENGQATVVDV